MNSDILTGRLKQLKGEILMLWADWFDNDYAWMQGNNAFLSGTLQEDYGEQQERHTSRSAH